MADRQENPMAFECARATCEDPVYDHEDDERIAGLDGDILHYHKACLALELGDDQDIHACGVCSTIFLDAADGWSVDSDGHHNCPACTRLCEATDPDNDLIR